MSVVSVTAPAVSLWLHPSPLVLASGSATRRAILTSAGIPVEQVSPDIDERAVEREAGDLSPADLAVRLARAKAAAGSRARPGRLVLGADQVLDCAGQIHHKAAERSEAAAKLSSLAGRTHHLTSAFVVIAPDGTPHAGLAVAALTMRSLTDAMIARYLDAAGDDVIQSVGAYRIEGLGVHLFDRIEGDHATIMGLPLLPLLAILRRLGAISP
jgi:septum formation protein